MNKFLEALADYIGTIVVLVFGSLFIFGPYIVTGKRQIGRAHV